jgi:hypothetical protein
MTLIIGQCEGRDSREDNGLHRIRKLLAAIRIRELRCQQ